MILNSANNNGYLLRDKAALSRFFLAPINTGFVTEGRLTEGVFRFHRHRSGRSIGVSYVGNVSVGDSYKSNQSTAVISRPLEAWRALASTILENGSIPGIQLACKLPTEVLPDRRWINRDIAAYVEATQKKISDLSRETIERIFADFVAASKLAVEAGFSVIQLHAAHGYFLSELFSRTLNTREDPFSHSAALLVLVKEVRRACPQAILDIRVSLKDGLAAFDAHEEEYRKSQILNLASTDVDMISLSAGLYEVNRFMIYPRAHDGESIYLNEARWYAKQCTERYWNVSGNVRSLMHLDRDEPSNLTFSIGRPLIADPAFVEKSLTGKDWEIQDCIYSGHCHYYTRGHTHISCKVNLDI